MLTLKNVVKRFYTEDIETTALNDISMTVNDGEFVAVMGPSGCGKSTLLSTLGMLDNIDEGHYYLDQKEVGYANEQTCNQLRNEKIGFIFQDFNLIDTLSVRENIELPLRYAGISSKRRQVRSEQLMSRFNIAHRADHRPLQLSGGQQQRVAIARALISRPRLILADEPTGNLDSETGYRVMTMIRDLNRDGTTVIMVTHSEADAQFADRVVKMLDGKILLDGQVS
jgi:putative ABC transport system ATP-binding protein